MSDLRDQITEALRAGRCCTGHIPRIADAVARRIGPEIERLTQRAEQAEKQRDAAVSSNRTLNAAIARLRGQHRAHEFGHCTSCGISVTWPCPTIAALDRPEPKDPPIRHRIVPDGDGMVPVCGTDDRWGWTYTSPGSEFITCPDCRAMDALDRPETADDATVRDATAPQDWIAEETT